MRLKRLRMTLGISLIIFAIVVGMVIATGTITSYFNSQQGNLMTTYAKQTIVQTNANNAAQTSQTAQSTVSQPTQNTQNTASQNTASQNTQSTPSQTIVSQPAPQPAPQPVIIQTRRTRAS